MEGERKIHAPCSHKHAWGARFDCGLLRTGLRIEQEKEFRGTIAGSLLNPDWEVVGPLH